MYSQQAGQNYNYQHNPPINTNQFLSYAPPGGNQQPYVIQITGSPDANYNSYNGKVSVGLGIAQLVIGILCLVLGIVLAIPFYNDYYCVMGGIVGHGIWCGVMFIIAGCFAIVAGRHKNFCLIVASMVLSIIAAVFTIGIYSTSSLDVALTSVDGDYSADKCYNKVLIVESLLLVFAFAEMIIAIITSALGCKVCCCKNQPNNQEMTQQVVYLPQLQPQPQAQATPQQALQPQPPRQAMSCSNPGGDAPPQYCEKRLELVSANDKQQLL